jgi:hypothetical protein
LGGHLCAYKPPPEILPGFPDATRVKPKTPISGKGNGLRRRWKNPNDGTIYEWDYRHGTVEKYDSSGKHQGEFRPDGTTIGPPTRNRKIQP